MKIKSMFGRFCLFSLFLLFLSFSISFAVLKSNPIKVLGELIGLNDYAVEYDTIQIHLDESIKNNFRNEIIDALNGVNFQGKKRFVFSDNTDAVSITAVEGNNSIIIDRYDLIPVVGIYSLQDNVSLDNLRTSTVYILNPLFEDYLNDVYGISCSLVDSYSSLVKKLSSDEYSVGLIEFGEIGREVKVISFNGKYFLDDENGGVHIDVYCVNVDEGNEYIAEIIKNNMPVHKEDIDRSVLGKVNMGGVVAIARDLLSKMGSVGSTTYPADLIGNFLADADLTHVSNEVSFVSGCKNDGGMRFCSDDRYIDVLKKSGVDIVELTGNHNNDYGSENNARTIEMYESLGIEYFGGGLDDVDAGKVLYKDVKGTNLAFVGYNYYDTIYNNTYVLAGSDRAGANSYSKEKLKNDIESAKSNGADVIIVTFQFQECYCYPDGDVLYPICYKPLSNPNQTEVFRNAIDLGADIVIGTQAHQPQTFEEYNGGMIFYGLGNLFFDQIEWIGTRQGLVLSHYLYDGKYIQTRITPTYMDKNFQVRLASEDEEQMLMTSLKEARQKIPS